MSAEAFIVLQLLFCIIALMIGLQVKESEIKELRKPDGVPLEDYSDEELEVLWLRIKVEKLKRFSESKEDNEGGR